jgi:quinoprotein glucose dehydrogenase
LMKTVMLANLHRVKSPTGLLCMALALTIAFASAPAPAGDWPAYGGGAEDNRYSPLKQIDASNVSKLQIAWTFDCQEPAAASETQPIVIDGVLYGLTPSHKAIAIDAATGRLKWRFDPGVPGRGPNRGVTYWASGDDRRIFTTAQTFVYALNAADGQLIKTFGRDGRIDLRENLGRDPSTVSIVLTSPGIIYKDLLIVGGRDPESLPAPPGDIRAYDVRTGALRWSFHTIPHPGEFGYDTWPKDAWEYSGAANNWAGMALDEARGLIYVPTGSAATDFYGADRIGDDLFANTLLALKAATGERVWHFQAVKHDMWDRDFPSPPTLVTVKRNGKSVDAVAQATKQGWLYLFDRATGDPLFPIEYRKYPASAVPGEVSADTQPLPTKPAPFARQKLTVEMLSNRTPEVHRWALEQFAKFRSEGQFIPLMLGQETVVFPGFDGGAEWGGSAFDPETGLYYVNANDLAWTSSINEGGRGGGARGGRGGRGASSQQLYLTNCSGCHGEDLAGQPPQFPSLLALRGHIEESGIAAIVRQGRGRMAAFPNLGSPEVAAIAQYVLTGETKELTSSGPPADPRINQKYRFSGYHKWLDPDGYPATAPPWGTLSAIDLNSGEYAWKIPLGEYPELAAKGVKDTGTENYGGPIVTAGGLVFIAATNFDRKFRAFDKRTGKLLWETELPLAGNATPITYEVAGRQYVVIYATGGKAGRGREPQQARDGSYVAFALPATPGAKLE